MISEETLNTFDKLFNESYPNVLKYVICNCSNIEDVKDVVQSVYLELLKILQKDKIFNKSNAYIRGITKNKVNEYYQFNYKAKVVSLFSKKDDFILLDSISDNIDLQKEDLKFIWNYLKKEKSNYF